MVDDLKNFGVTYDKTIRGDANELKNNSHFWRGTIDGDGTFNEYTSKKGL